VANLEKTVTDLSTVDEKYRSLYVDMQDGSFSLDIEIPGYEPVDGLKSKNVELLNKLATEKAEKQRLRDEAAKKTEADLIAKNQFDQVLATRAAEFKEKQAAAAAEIERLQGSIKNSMLDAAVSRLSAELFGDSADIFKGHVANRFMVAEENGAFKVQILDINGQPSNMTHDQLAEAFKADVKLQKFIVGRDSSGGGANAGQPGTIAATDSAWDQFFDHNSGKVSLTKQLELLEKDPAMYERLSKKHEIDPYKHRSALPVISGGMSVAKGRNAR
jgi:hypothetical protein